MINISKRNHPLVYSRNTNQNCITAIPDFRRGLKKFPTRLETNIQITFGNVHPLALKTFIARLDLTIRFPTLHVPMIIIPKKNHPLMNAWGKGKGGGAHLMKDYPAPSGLLMIIKNASSSLQRPHNQRENTTANNKHGMQSNNATKGEHQVGPGSLFQAFLTCKAIKFNLDVFFVAKIPFFFENKI